MNTITVNTSKPYQVIIGNGILAKIGEYMHSMSKITKVAIISDSNVWPLYGNTVFSSLKARGLDVVHFVFQAGEESKTIETYFCVLNFLAENKLTRSDCIVALGGGVVGDLTGFAAATYLRGIPYIQVPTSLLAMVDSSVGGKTAIDLPAGKNLVGAFYQPCLVFCDIDTLNTLPAHVFTDGCAEVIKYGVLYDPALFSHLADRGLDFDREQVISRCVTLKRDVVIQDEFDTGARQKLNLGHTIGHGIEARSNFTVSHGQAVAMGMAIIAKAGWKNHICSEETYRSIITALKKFTLPFSTEYTASDLFSCALSDKKRFGGTVNLIIPDSIGNCIIQPTPVTQLLSFIEAGL